MVAADEPGRDVRLYDYDGYDWQGLGKSPEACLHDTGHSFGHGVVISFLLLGINPAELSIKALPVLVPEAEVKLNVDWTECYDSYDWGKGKQKPMSATAKLQIEQFASSVLGINLDDAKKCWGTAYPPGCFAATVIRVTRASGIDLKKRANKSASRFTIVSGGKMNGNEFTPSTRNTAIKCRACLQTTFKAFWRLGRANW